MATNENLIPIPGRLHSVATESHVAGADEIYDDTLNKDQATINSEVNAAIGTGGSVDLRIAAAINALDSEKSQTAGGDGLALSVTEVDGKITSISGYIAANTYDANGAAATAKTEVIGGATSSGNTLKKLEDRVSPLETAVGTGGSVDSRISSAVNAAKSELKGNATSACDTLGEAEALISAEKTRAQGAESTLQNNISAETTRAQAAESNLNSGKADKATTLAGYGITDAYTKSETYTKTEVNGLVDTPHQEYVTVNAYSALPATGSKDTIYRVSNYNGSTSQVDASVYSEYAWNGSQYIFLCVKSQIGEVFDISVYNNNAKYADLAAALNGGANIPQSLQKGGMSIKFVQGSDNKYVQYRLMSDMFNTTVANWQGVDDEPTAGSNNLVKSGSIKACMDSKIDIESINLYNTEDFLHNKAIDRQGNIIDSSGGGSVSNYIPINGKNITFNLIFNRYNSIAVYNEDYTLRRVITTEDYYSQYTYTYQAGDSYIRVCVLDNRVKMAFYGNSMKNYTPFNPIAKYLLNAKPYFAITNNLELNKRIKELYIKGSLNSSKYYGVYSCYHYNGRYQFYIMQSDTPDLAGTDIVASYDSDQRPEGVLELESYVNNVKVYGVFSCIDEEQPYQYRELINIPYVQDLAYSPAIYSWLHKTHTSVYVNKLGGGDFTKLSDAISYSLLHKDVVINIAPGEYDLVDELGTDYFENMTNEHYQGLKLGNGVTLRSTGNGVVIKALYNGNNVNVGYQYSLFNIIGTCTVENISFIAYNTRYVIHDDLDTVHYPDVKDYIVSFKGCRFNHKGSTMYDITQSVPISIGGGCVKNSTHIFEECIFESEADIVTEDLSYHNSYNCNSKVTVNNCYFGGDKTIAGRASNLTSGTVNWFVSNNRFGNQPKLYNPELIHVIEFGNIIDS